MNTKDPPSRSARLSAFQGVLSSAGIAELVPGDRF
jgi:hypothetical protein